LQAGGDSEASPTAVVSRSFALRYLQTDDPIGYRFRWVDSPDAPWIRIVGVAEDAVFGVLGEEPHQPVVYESLGPPIPTSMYLIVRSPHGVPRPDLADAVRSAVHEIDPRIAVYEVQSLARLLERESWLHRMFAVLFGILGVTALLLTVLGLYGVISFNAQARTHEFGIRSALGAERRSLHLLALREGLFQLGLGLALGLLLAYWITRSLSSVLPGLEADGLSIPLLVVSVLTATGLLACHLPARRAAKVDPTTLLKQL
jgi:hypothetical protein